MASDEIEFRRQALDEIHWGNQFFHFMITDEGQVYEDVGGGEIRGGFDYESGWWNENHPGVTAGGDVTSDTCQFF